MPEEKVNLKEKTALVYDYGLFTEMASALVKDFRAVYYYVPWQDDFPSSLKQKIGLDFDGLIRIQNFWDYVDKVDIIIGFDTYMGDLIQYLREKGYRVWGAGRAEIMEIERWKMRKMQKAVGLPTQNTLLIKSLSDLELYFNGIRNFVKKVTGEENRQIENKILKNILKKYDNFSEEFYIGDEATKEKVLEEWIKGARNKFVKVKIRGDIESFYASDYLSALSKFNSLAEQYGHREDAKEVEFIVEDRIEGIEPGFDGIQINGEYLFPAMAGYEIKGGGYAGRIYEENELPEPYRILNEKLSIIFKKLAPTCSFYSNEFILTKDRKPYLIDPTIRNPAPVGSALHSEMIENLGEIIWYGAEGKIVKPKYSYKYGIGIACDSEWAEKHELEIEFKCPRNRIKFRKVYKKDGKYYALPGLTTVCSIIGLGNTLEDAVSDLRKNAEMVSAYHLDVNPNTINEILERVKEGEEYGIHF